MIGEAADGLEAIDEVRRLRPNVVLMDIRMPELDGLSATRQLIAERPDLRVLALTTFDLDEYVFEALRAGASGILLKDAPAEELTTAIHVLTHVSNILAKLRLRDRIHAVIYAYETGLVRPGSNPPAHRA